MKNFHNFKVYNLKIKVFFISNVVQYNYCKNLDSYFHHNITTKYIVPVNPFDSQIEEVFVLNYQNWFVTGQTFGVIFTGKKHEGNISDKSRHNSVSKFTHMCMTVSKSLHGDQRLYIILMWKGNIVVLYCDDFHSCLLSCLMIYNAWVWEELDTVNEHYVVLMIPKNFGHICANCKECFIPVNPKVLWLLANKNVLFWLLDQKAFCYGQ